jgi:hypothetical protein
MNEVIEWFEIMEANGQLANTLIELVYERIKSGKPLESSIYTFNDQVKTTMPLDNPIVSQVDFFDNLYDLHGSSSAVFKDEQEEKKIKKKMLYV